MGRWYCGKKRTVEDCKSISMSFLRKDGYLSGFHSGQIVWTNRAGEETASLGAIVSTLGDEHYLRLLYTMTDRDTGKETHFDYKVQLEATPCHFGGVRWWFICPLTVNGVRCGRRVGVLYRAPRADYYGCRHCYDLSYESRNERRYGRVAYLGHCMTLSTRIKKLQEHTRRWTYRGVPTKRMQRLFVLRARLNAYAKEYLPDLLQNREGS
jgi:hypothetical protein